jgi:hypothetical protein
LSVLPDTLDRQYNADEGAVLTVPSRLVLFASSYAPLLALFAILDSFGPGWPTLLCASAAVVSVVALVLVWTLAGRSAASWLTLATSRNHDKDVMAFFVSYVVPFAAAHDAHPRTRIALATFAVIIAALYVRSAIFYTHPLLLLAGYHIYEATTDTEVPVILITRRRYLRQRETLWTTRIGPSVHRERRRRG